ncbi:MAG: glutamate--tRNA ligase [Acidiferrobacterales bacterium]
MNDTSFRTRFAPSPTGLLHLGNIRTALFNFLLARSGRGVFLLRIEDTDAVRGRERYSDALQEDLRWLGLTWDEGPQAGGSNGPYFQSQRGPVYARYFALLLERGFAYRCFCTEHELEAERRTQIVAGRPPRYSGRCRLLTKDQVDERLAAGMPATLRFHVGSGTVVEFEDRVRGRQQFHTEDIGDFIIRRSDGTPSFFFSNAIDDAVMGITLVVRGEDHLANTPRQILILQALELPLPEYAHIALVVGADGSPLSKRTGSRSVQELREGGFLPLSINNYIARLGHTYDDNELLPLDRLAGTFGIDRLHRAPAHYDEAQLLHWQKEAVLRVPEEELWRWLSAASYPDGGRIERLVPQDRVGPFVEAVRENVMTPFDAYVWAGNLFAGTTFDIEARDVIGQAGNPFFRSALECLPDKAGQFKSFSAALSKATGTRGKSLFMPLRAALTGAVYDSRWPRVWPHGPALERIWLLLGPARIRRRLEEAARLAGVE